MSISSDYRTSSAPSATPAAPVESSAAKNSAPQKISDGVIKAEIVDIKKDSVTLRSEDGQIITGRLTARPSVGIGGTGEFTIARDENNNITVTPTAVPQREVFTELLKSYGMKPTEENLKALEFLLQNNIPLTKEAITKFNQGVKLLGSAEKALFFIENDIRPTLKNSEIFKSLLDGSGKLSGQLNELLNTAENIKDPVLKSVVADLLTNGGANSESGSVALLGKSADNVKMLTEAFLRTSQPENAAQPNNAQTNVTQTSASQTNVAQTSTVQTNATQSNQSQTTTPATQVQQGQQSADSVNVRTAQNPSAPPQSGQQPIANQPGFTDTTSPGAMNIADLASTISKAIRQEGFTFEKLAAIINENGIGTGTTNSDARFRTLVEDLLKENRGLIDNIIKRMAADDASPALHKLATKLTFDMRGTKPQDLDRFLNTLAETLKTTRDYVKANLPQSPENLNLLKDMENITDHLKFAGQLKNTVYVQFPVMVSDREANAELFVFKDRNAKKSSGAASSALIALDTLSLGRFEAFVQKDSHAVYCQFRVKSDEIERLTTQHISNLNDLLRSAGYTLENYSFRRLEEAFTIADSPDTAKFAEAGTSKKSFTFDIRT